MLKIIKKSVLVMAMTTRKVNNLILTWCDEFEHIMFYEKVW